MDQLYKPLPYKVSTITAIASILCVKDTILDLPSFFHSVDVCELGSDGFTYIEYAFEKSDIRTKGYHKKMAIVRRKKPAEKRFDNQITFLLSHVVNEKALTTNLKVFRNGNIQMTGLKTLDQGHHAIQYLADHIKKHFDIGAFKIVDDLQVVQPGNFNICLINSDFRTGIIIKRDKLYKLLQRTAIFSSYEPVIYPAVKISYMYNSLGDGVCACANSCLGKGCGTKCKKITIAVFGSGCVIITGAQSFEQLDSAYNFICAMIQKNLNDVGRPID
jgi:TATA-box binding protein (TBP) (component of TFIID and TFIIIB)